jgi:hypothetical protein
MFSLASYVCLARSSPWHLFVCLGGKGSRYNDRMMTAFFRVALLSRYHSILGERLREGGSGRKEGRKEGNIYPLFSHLS